MGSTISTDLVIPEILRTEVNVDFAKYLDFRFGGMVDQQNVDAGEFVNVRGFNELSGDDEVMTDNGVYGLNNVSTFKDIAVILHRIKKFGAEDLAQIVSGMDATTAIKMMISTFFVKQASSRFINVLTGLFSATGPLYTANRKGVYVDTATAGDRVKLTPAVAAVAAGLLGDNMLDLGVYMMHSAVHATLLAAGYLETSPNLSAYGIAGGQVNTFMGKPIVVSDTLPVTSGTNCDSYRTYLAGKGSLFLGTQKPINPEQSRDSNKIDIISTDAHYCAHVRGCKWNVATANPTNVALETGTNWALAYSSAKQVRVVAIDHNI